MPISRALPIFLIQNNSCEAMDYEDFYQLDKQLRERIKQMRIEALFDEPSTFEDEEDTDRFLGENI